MSNPYEGQPYHQDQPYQGQPYGAPGQPDPGQQQPWSPQPPQPGYSQPAYGQPVSGQPAYGQPAYGPPAPGYPPQGYGPAPQPRGSGKMWIIIGGGVVGLLLISSIIFVAVYQLRGGADPEATVNRMFQAIEDKDRATFIDQFCKEYRDQFLKVERANFFGNDNEVLDWEVLDSTTADSTAEVSVRYRQRDGDNKEVTDTATFTLVKEGDDWKICSIEEDDGD